MKKIFTILIGSLLMTYGTNAQLVQSCFTENFNSQTTGWTYGQGAGEGPYTNPGGCISDRGITTPGVGGNNPANVFTPIFVSSGAFLMQVSFDIFCVNANLNCNSWKDFGCPTSIDVFYHIGATRYIGITDLVLPSNGPTNSPTVSFNFAVGNNLPAGTSYRLELAFKAKSGIGNCGQPGTKYILDNFKRCEINCLNCTLDAINDNFCLSSNTSTVTGSVATNDIMFQGANPVYSLANGPFANGNSVAGGANLVINTNGSFTITRTDETKTVFDFTYRVIDPLTGLSDLASVTVCFPDGAILPVTLTDFYASRKDENVLLKWKTSAELNALEFIVERITENGYVQVGVVAATNSSAGSNYSFLERNLSKTASLYRLRMVDRDQTSRFSEVRTVKGLGAIAEYNVFPNPTNGAGKIMITDATEAKNFQLFDNMGRTIRTIQVSNTGVLDVNGLQKGVYFLRMTKTLTGEPVTRKVIIN